MKNRRSTEMTERVLQSCAVPWERLEKQTVSAFTLAGVLLVGSLIVPVGLKTVTSWAWVFGFLLVGLAVVSVATGLGGLYPTTKDHSPRLATVGLLSGIIAGVAAFGLIAMGGIALVGEGAFGMHFGKPINIFIAVTLSMAGGYSTGFLSFGIARWQFGGFSRTVAQLLFVGGALLLVPVVGAVLRRGFGIESGIPPWIFLPTLGLVALDTLAIGYCLRAEKRLTTTSRTRSSTLPRTR